MSRILLAAPFLFLSACAATNGGEPARMAAADGAALYCWERKVMEDGDGKLCNWAKTAKEACRSSDYTVVRNAAIASGPAKSRRCENGEWLVMVTTR